MNFEFNPEMLSLARELRSMTQTDLANGAGLTQGTISKYEGGIQTPSDDEIVKLAEALQLPSSFLYQPYTRRGTIDGHIFHRKKAKTSVVDTRRIDGHLEVFQFHTAELLKDLDFDAPYYVPQLELDDYNGDPELIAEAVRSLWEMPRGPVSHLVQQLEAAGCFVYFFDFETDDIDENVQWIPPNPPVMVANTRASGDRLRFSLAHALGHLVMHHNKIPHKDRETEAHKFASAFLMPANDIIDYIKPVTLEHLFELKPYWKVSVASMIMRAHDLQIINDRRKSSLFQMMSRSGWRTREPGVIDKEKPELIFEILDMYRTHLSYSDAEMAKKLKISVRDFRRMYYPNTTGFKVIKKPSDLVETQSLDKNLS